MIHFTKDLSRLPDYISQDLKDRAKYFAVLIFLSKKYSVPVTHRVKKLFGITARNSDG